MVGSSLHHAFYMSPSGVAGWEEATSSRMGRGHRQPDGGAHRRTAPPLLKHEHLFPEIGLYGQAKLIVQIRS